MTDFVLKGRILTDDEQLILFGVTNISAVKALDIENYFDMFTAIHSGENVVLPEQLSITDDTDHVYVYCDIPSGSRFFYDQCNSYSPDATSMARPSIGNVPSEYTTYRVTELLYPSVRKWVDMLSDSNLIRPATDSLSNYRTMFNTSRGGVAAKAVATNNIMTAGMVLTLHNSRVISAVTFSELHSKITENVPYKNFANVDPVLVEESYLYSKHLLPKDTLDSLGVISENGMDYALAGNKYEKMIVYIDSIKRLFNWSIDKVNTAIVIGPSFIRINSLVCKDDETFLYLPPHHQALSSYQSGRRDGYSLAASFSNFFTSVDPTDATKKAIEYFSSIAVLGNLNARGSNSEVSRSNFLFLNQEAIRSKEEIRVCLPEMFLLNSEFFSSMRDAFNDVNPSNREAGIKANFSLRQDTSLNETEVSTARYDTLASPDNKLFFLVKTSKAKDALKKAAISRKITNSMDMVTSFVVRLFATRDLLVGAVPVGKHLQFGVSSRGCLGNSAYVNFTTELLAISKNLTDIQSNSAANIANIKQFVSTLYNTTVCNTDPLLMGILVPGTFNRYSSFDSLDANGQKANCFKSLWDPIVSSCQRSLYSPSANTINILVLAGMLYNDSSKWTPTVENSALMQSRCPTGHQIHYLYTSNFIDADETLTHSIESNKTSSYVYLSCSSAINVSSCFNWSQDATDTFTSLRKAKTYKDYHTWYEKVLPAVKTTIKDTFEVTDNNMFIVLNTMADIFQTRISLLATEEVPFLPAETVKKRGRKKGSTVVDGSVVEATEDETEDTNGGDAVENAVEENIEQELVAVGETMEIQDEPAF